MISSQYHDISSFLVDFDKRAVLLSFDESREIGMHSAFKKLHTELVALRETISSAAIPQGIFIQQYGWNQTALDSSDLCYAIDNLTFDITQFDIEDIGEYEGYLESQNKKIVALNDIAKGHYNNNAGHLVHLVPNIAITVMVIHRDLEKTFFKWEVMEEKKLLPKNMLRRLRNTEARINAIDTSSSDLEEKVKAINSAHEAAENLPTDLEELKRTQKQIGDLLKDSKEMLAEIQLTEKSAEASLEALISHEEAARKSKEKTDTYVDECDKALQITTTEGLASGFDQKAKELSKSINKWVGGLVFALVTGGVLGAHRVNELTMALTDTTSMGVGEGLIQTVLTIFSIGGPLWFAWLATQQITQRFKLSEDYSYKATVAKSYTGFSKQANRFGSDVEERLFKATLDRLEEMPLRLVEGKDYSSPWHEFIDSDVVKHAIDKVPGFRRELDIFAKNTKRKVTDVKQDAHRSNVTQIDGDTDAQKETG